MVSILLTVLKIIGIIILIILGLILCILLLVLFVPVRYQAAGVYDSSRLTADMRVTWLLHAASFRADFCRGQAFHMRLKLLGISVYDNQKAAGKSFKHKKNKLTKTKSEDAGEISAASVDDEQQNAVEESQRINTRPDLTIDTDADKNTVDKDNIDEKNTDINVNDEDVFENKPHKPHKPHIFQKIKIIFINFANFFKNIKFTFQKICDTIVKIKANIKYYLELLQLDSTKRAFSVCRNQLGWLFKNVLPKRFRLNLHLGFEDPATMGEVLAVWGMFYPIHQGNINIQPEFEEAVIEGNFSLKGRTSVFVFVKAACILFFDKDVKLLIKHFKRNKI